jgi:Helix-hairpin-helix domain
MRDHSATVNSPEDLAFARRARRTADAVDAANEVKLAREEENMAEMRDVLFPDMPREMAFGYIDRFPRELLSKPNTMIAFSEMSPDELRKWGFGEKMIGRIRSGLERVGLTLRKEEEEVTLKSLFGGRIANPLARQKITTIEDLCEKTAEDLQKIIGIGPDNVATIRARLALRGEHLKPSALPEGQIVRSVADITRDIFSNFDEILKQGRNSRTIALSTHGDLVSAQFTDRRFNGTLVVWRQGDNFMRILSADGTAAIVSGEPALAAARTLTSTLTMIEEFRRLFGRF